MCYLFRSDVRKEAGKEAFALFILYVLSVIILMHTFTSSTYADSKGGRMNEIIPAPVDVKMLDGQFTVTSSTAIVTAETSGQVKGVAECLACHLGKPTGFSLKISSGDKGKAKNAVMLKLNESKDSTIGDEGYRLSVKSDGICITANEPAGLFYGVQTLLGLMPVEIESPGEVEGVEWAVPCVEIVDYPRFAWRGLLLDVARHFFTKEEVMQFIDRMARYKFNTFQMHLSDDQGWRVEIKRYPKLTEVGAWRVPRAGRWWELDVPAGLEEKPTYGGFYTQEDVRELVVYAKSRFVTILPEFDVPGHSMAALAAYPNLSCTGGPFHVNSGAKFYGVIQNTLCVGNDEVFEFLDGLFTEVAELFDHPYIHMGGDEAFKGFWADCPKCQKRKKEEGLKDEDELQSYFVKRVEKIIESKGRRLLGWDEILEGGLAPNATVMSWRGVSGGIAAAKMGHEVVMTPSPYYYLDLYQGDPVIEPSTYSMSRLNTCYQFEPVPKGVDAELILGIQGNVWTEEISELRHAEYMTWPRGFAVAESAWSPSEKKSWVDFIRRTERQFERLDVADTKYARCMYDVIFEPSLDDDGKMLIKLATELEGLDIYYTFEGANPDHHYPRYVEPLGVPLNAYEIRVVTYRHGKPIGKQINMPIEELQKCVKK